MTSLIVRLLFLCSFIFFLQPVLAENITKVQVLGTPTSTKVPKALIMDSVIDTNTESIIKNEIEQLSVASTEMQSTTFSGHDLSPWGMYQAADRVVKSVLIALLSASVLTWAICLFKIIQLNLARHRTRRLLRRLVNAENYAQACAGLEEKQGDAFLLVQASSNELQLSSGRPTLDEALKERILARLERGQASLIANMNQGTGILASIGSVGPFVGLFGTVWGIMNSFIGIAQTQTTNLAVVAPGIAEALLATAAGLLAAIPAVVIYNYFSRAIGCYRSLIADIITALMVLISRDLDLHHPDSRELPDLITETQAKTISLVQGMK